MDIRNRSALKQAAASALDGAQNEKKLIAVYTGVTIGLSVLVLLLDALLNRAMSGTGGLGSMDTRAILDTLKSALPILQLLMAMCWDMGYLRSMLNLSRGQDPQVRSLTQGFSLFFPILRLDLILGVILGGVAFGCMYLSIWIFLFTPFATPLMEVVSAESGSMLSTQIVVTDTMMEAATQALPPVLVIFLVFFCAIVVPLIYRYRMARYCLLENPQRGALAALGESRRMMRGNRLALLKLDLSIWWFYLLEAMAMALCYGDMILSFLGVSLPISADVSLYLFNGLYFVMIFLVYYFLRNYKETIYAKAYDALKPPEVPNNGLVLGNIFQM